MFKKLSVAFCFVIYLLLAYKDPYSSRTLVSNLEPYPDTFYYSIPAWNLVHGKGLVMYDGVKTSNWITPPVYTLYLVPFFAITRDVRSYYFANILLGLGSLLVFYKLVRLIYNDKWWLSVGSLFFLATNYYFYTVSSLLMAENISIFLVLLGVYLCAKLEGKGRLSPILLSIVSLLILLTKFSNLSLAVVLFTFGLWRALALKSRSLIQFICYILPLLLSIFYIKFSGIMHGQVNTRPEVGFSSIYFVKNLVFYVFTMFGGETKYLWFANPFGWKIVLWFGLTGLLLAFFVKKDRYLVKPAVTLIFSLVIFMAFFYFPDARYIQTLLPLILIFCLYLFRFLPASFSRVSVLGFLIIYALLNVRDWKYQIALNTKYAEVPWNYIGIQQVNRYFEHRPDEQAVVFSFLPRYMYYYFSNNMYRFEPILSDGRFDIEVDVIKRIEALLYEGKKLYLTEAYKGNQRDLSQRIMKDIGSRYRLETVDEGCYSSCNIYIVKTR